MRSVFNTETLSVVEMIHKELIATGAASTGVVGFDSDFENSSTNVLCDSDKFVFYKGAEKITIAAIDFKCVDCDKVFSTFDKRGFKVSVIDSETVRLFV